MAALRLPIAGTDQHGVRARRRPALVHGAVRPRQPDRVAAEHPDLPRIRPRRAGRAGPLAGEGTRRLSRRRARQDHARAALRRAGAFQADPAHAVLRHRGCHAAVSDHAACRLARHRRPRVAGAASRDRRGLPRLDRRLGRSRRRRVPGVPDALAGRLREHGLEGCRRFHELYRRHAGEGTEGAVRVAGLCLRRLATHGGDLRRARRAEPRRELRDKAAALFQRFNDAFWDEESGFYAFMLDGEKRKVLSVASNPGHLPVVRHRAAGPRRARRRTADGARHELRLGHPHAVGRSIPRSIRIPIRTARSGRTTTA